MTVKLRNSFKILNTIKNSDNKCFLGCHIRHLNPLKSQPKRIRKADGSIVNDLHYENIKFPVSKKYYSKIDQKNNICINVFSYEYNLVYPVHISDQIFKDCMNLLMITNK